MTTLEVLQKARGYIAKREHWCHGWGSMDSLGDGMTCAVGAVRVATLGSSNKCTCPECDRSGKARGAISALTGVVGVVGENGVIGYNDSHDHECVIAMYDAAIEQEKQKVAK